MRRSQGTRSADSLLIQRTKLLCPDFIHVNAARANANGAVAKSLKTRTSRYGGAASPVFEIVNIVNRNLNFGICGQIHKKCPSVV